MKDDVTVRSCYMKLTFLLFKSYHVLPKVIKALKETSDKIQNYNYCRLYGRCLNEVISLNGDFFHVPFIGFCEA